MREGIILQLIGVALFTPLVFGWLIEGIDKFIKSTIIFLFSYIKRNKEAGQLISTAYLKTIEQLDTSGTVKEKSKALLWAWFVNGFAIFALLGFLAWFHINWLEWIPNWLKWASILYGALLILDVLTAALWDWVLYRINWIRHKFESTFRAAQVENQQSKTLLRTTYLILSLALINPPRNRVLKKIIINFAYFFIFPIFATLISLQLTLFFTVKWAVNSRITGNVITLLGWAFVVSGLIVQLMAS